MTDIEIPAIIIGNPFVAPLTVRSLRVWVAGRPAPQGSKRQGAHGQMREASNYLPAWRAAVKKAVYEEYVRLGIPAEVTNADGWALFRGPVGIATTFRLDPSRRVDAEPDIDKLLRAVFDELTKTRVWEDDGRVVYSTESKAHAEEAGTGAAIEVWAVTP